MNVSGIILPNLTVSLNGEKVMEDYVGRTVFLRIKSSLCRV